MFEVILFLGPLLVIVTVIIAYYVRKVFRWSDNNHSEGIKQEVRLTEKIEKYVILGACPAIGLGGPISPMRFYLIFRTADGQEIKCQVPENKYISVSEGSEGILTMQGTRFISFERIEENG